MVFRYKSLLFALLLSILPSVGFGLANNNVRVNKFEWMHAQTDHFDIYFDSSTERLVPHMAKHLEDAWRDVGAAFRFEVKERTPFFFYSNHNEFEQTNIVPIGEGTGGVTEAFKNRFLVFNDGSEEWMRHVIYHEFSHVVQFNILYGGFWKSVRLLKSPFYPLWAMEGSAEYGSGSIDEITGDMVTRDAVAFGKLPSLEELQGFGHLKPNQVTLGYKTGEAAMHFLKEEYGVEKFQEFMPILKDHFDVSSALDNLLGCNLEWFDFRFQEWMVNKYDTHIKNSIKAGTYGERLTFSDGIPQFNEAPVVSPDGKKIYFFSDRGGPTQLYEMDRITKKVKALIGLRWKKYENIETRGRALSISSDGRFLAFSAEKKQKDFLFVYDLVKKKLSRISVPFDQIRTPVFSPFDDSLVCVGMKRGFNDLYLINREGQVLRQLTDNPQDEKDPVFSRDGKEIFYSGEVFLENPFSIERDLFSVHTETREIRKLTSLVGRENEPDVLPDGSVVFTRDRLDDGQLGFDLYHVNLSSPSFSLKPLTKLVGGAFTPRYSPAVNALFFVAFENGEKHVFQGTWTFTNSHPSAHVAPAEDPFWNEVRRSNSLESNMAWNNQDAGIPYLKSSPKPYRFQSSTDIFLPFFLYSSQDGFVMVDVWQYSDLMGNHQLQQQLQYASGNDLVDLAISYTYSRYRPDFTFGFRGQKYYRDFEEEDRRREINGFGLMSYPLDRVSSVQLGAGVTDRKDTFLDETEDETDFDDRFLLTGFQYDTVTGRYLVPTKGHRLNFFYQQGFETIGGNQKYKTHGLEGVKYWPLQKESTLASRLFYGRSTGLDRQVFRLGGVDRIRAVPRSGEENKKSNIVFSSTEMRLRIKYLNARTRFLFPDFFFKAAYLIVFDDVGYGWDDTDERNAFKPRKLKNAAGVGISWPTFILQTFQLNLGIQWARQTNNGSDVWYVTVGPSF